VPDPAIENAMLDALAYELGKIGTNPLSNWLTQSPPILKRGVPGDSPPGPNLLSMYLQHLSTEFLDGASGPTASHRASVRLGVWVVSTDPDTGATDALNLKADVLRAIFAAEGTIGAMFDGGIWPGGFEFSAGEAGLRAGTYLGMLEVRIETTVPHDLSLTFDPTLLSYELERTLLRVYPFSVMPTTERIDAQMHAVLEPPGLILGTVTPAANKIAEVRIEENLTYNFLTGPSGEFWYQYATEIACTIGPQFPTQGSTTMFAGIEIGTFGQSPPFPSAPGVAVVQLRWNYGNTRWELVSAAGDGSAAQVAILTGSGTFTGPGATGRARLLYDPVNRKVQAYMNGVLGAEITDITKLPQFANMATPFFCGAFATSGVSAGAIMAPVFSACHCKSYNTTKPGAALWY